MIYLLDANVLIDAARDYYPIGRVPEFWDWLAHHANSGLVRMPIETYEEVAESEDELGQWLRRDDIRDGILHGLEVEPALVNRVLRDGYADDLTDDEVIAIGRDPFLIAHAIGAPNGACVVTTERSKPSQLRHNRKVPDVCNGFGVPWCHTFEFVRRVDFSTGWRGRL